MKPYSPGSSSNHLIWSNWPWSDLTENKQPSFTPWCFLFFKKIKGLKRTHTLSIRNFSRTPAQNPRIIWALSLKSQWPENAGDLSSAILTGLAHSCNSKASLGHGAKWAEVFSVIDKGWLEMIWKKMEQMTKPLDDNVNRWQSNMPASRYTEECLFLFRKQYFWLDF